MQRTHTIRLQMPLRLGNVNCYLISCDEGYLLVDTGSSNQRDVLISELESAGCQPGDLKLIVITHGDFDHTGNAAYLRERYNTAIAMHPADYGMIEEGNMFSNRDKGNAFLGKTTALLFGFGKAHRCTPDLPLDEGASLAEYGLNAEILSLPGHSKGSIGILTEDGDLFCGDLLENTSRPAPGSIIADLEAASASIARLKQLGVQTVYPGHGDPFPMDALSAK